MHRESDLTILLVSHNLAVVGFLCSRIAVMRNGKIVGRSDIDAIRARNVEHEYTRRMLEATGDDRRATVPA